VDALERHFSRLHRDIHSYLEFLEIVKYEDPLWREYEAWKALTERHRLMRERIAAYTLLEE
jgi:hypothetical protein